MPESAETVTAPNALAAAGQPCRRRPPTSETVRRGCAPVRRAGLLRTGCVPAIIAAHLALALPLAAWLNIWEDEAYSLVTTSRGVHSAIGLALREELQPPLYFAALALWRRAVGESIFAARLLSVVLAVLTICITAGLSRRYLPGRHPGWLASAVAFNPFLVWAALEIRVYAAAVLLSGLLLRFYHDGFAAVEPRRRARVWFAVTAVAALYTQYYLGFLLAALAVPLLVRRNWPGLRRYLAAMSVAAAGFAPVACLLPWQFCQHTGDVREAVTAWHAVRHVVSLAAQHLTDAPGPRLLDLMLSGAWAAVAGAFACRQRPPHRRPLQALSIATVALAACLMLLTPVVGTGLVARRHAAVLFLPTVVTAFGWIATGPRKALWGAAVFSLCLHAATLADTYRPLAKRGDWQRVTQYIMQQEQPRQPILVFRASRIWPLEYYYRGVNRLVPIPPQAGAEQFSPRSQVLTDEEQIATAIASAEPDPRAIWLITSGAKTYLGVDFRGDILDRYVSRHFDVVLERQFYQSQVKLLRRKHPPAGHRPSTSHLSNPRPPACNPTPPAVHRAAIADAGLRAGGFTQPRTVPGGLFP